MNPFVGIIRVPTLGTLDKQHLFQRQILQRFISKCLFIQVIQQWTNQGHDSQPSHGKYLFMQVSSFRQGSNRKKGKPHIHTPTHAQNIMKLCLKNKMQFNVHLIPNLFQFWFIRYLDMIVLLWIVKRVFQFSELFIRCVNECRRNFLKKKGKRICFYLYISLI